jgi:hypothetical protein
MRAGASKRPHIEATLCLGSALYASAIHTYGHHAKLTVPDWDVLIHAGDFTTFGDTPQEIVDFNQWLGMHLCRRSAS